LRHEPEQYYNKTYKKDKWQIKKRR
jgi:hypothetical protein